jgi:hypothetical protein
MVMKRRLIRRFLARAWVRVAAFVIVAVGLTLAFVTWRCPGRLPSLLELLGGAFVSVMVTWAIYAVLLSLAVRVNAGPFRKGDTVEILVGPHRGKIGQVHEEWKERDEVRVDIGADAANRCEDVFGHVELVRVKELDPLR